MAGCGSAATTSDVAFRSTTVVWGAGTPVDFPFYEEVGSALSADAITLNYQQIGGAGATSGFRTGQLGFLAEDGPGPPARLLRRGPAGAEYIPVARWAVAVIYNLPTVHVRLRLDAKTLADMYRGSVKQWNSREIARENPGVRLPAIPIRVVHRSDAATSTAVLTSYMAAGSPRWRRTVGSGSAVRWPGGTADAGDSAMLATVAQDRGTIGYIEQNVALVNGFATAALRNSAGAFVPPTLGAATSGRYPVVAQAYLLVHRDLCAAGMTRTQATATRSFATYLLGPGQAVVARLRFAPLPPRLRTSALAQVDSLLCQLRPIA